MLTILVDMDSTVADWDGRYDQLLDEAGSSAARLPRRHQRHVFNLHNGLGPRQSGVVRRIMDTPGFYRDIPLIDGADVALNEMLDEGYAVYLCSTPWTSNPTCASDKYEWADRYLGQGWSSRVILTADKTLVRGDVLIDDKPNIHGLMQPSWTQVLFDATYNRDLDQPRLVQWSSWGEIVWSAMVRGAIEPQERVDSVTRTTDSYDAG